MRWTPAPRPNAIRMKILPEPELNEIKWSRYSKSKTSPTDTDKLVDSKQVNFAFHSNAANNKNEKYKAEIEESLIWIRKQASNERIIDQPVKTTTDTLKGRCHRSDVKVNTNLITGNSYYGPWNLRGFNGRGMYRFADGPLYTGYLKDGHFNGHGILTFPNGNKIEGFWDMGITQYLTFTFEDGLEYKTNNWGYCQEPDRRYVFIIIARYIYLLTLTFVTAMLMNSFNWRVQTSNRCIQKVEMAKIYAGATTIYMRKAT